MLWIQKGEGPVFLLVDNFGDPFRVAEDMERQRAHQSRRIKRLGQC